MSDPVRILRIAVLECDTLLPEAQSKYGRYCNVYNDFLKSGIKLYKEQYPSLQAPRLEISAYDVFEAQEYPDVEAVDVILISGSSMSYLFFSFLQSSSCSSLRCLPPVSCHPLFSSSFPSLRFAYHTSNH